MRVRPRTTVLSVAVALAGTLAAAAPVSAAPVDTGRSATASTRPGTLFPTTFALPDGFQPEGIAIGALPYAFFGSRATGAIYRVNLVTGRGEQINAGSGTPSQGLKVDLRGRLFVGGGNSTTGAAAKVFNAFTGELLTTYQFNNVPSFVNDVVLTPDAAWFTDSTNPVLYKLPLNRWGGLPDADETVTLPLTGDIVYGAGINANGIETTPDGRGLLVVQSGPGLLFRVDPATGVARTVDLGGEVLTNGDGLLRDGRTLYVVQNRLNTVSVFELDRAGTSGRLVERVTSAGFDVPTTVAAYGNRLYLPNGRFTTPPTATTPYTVTAIPRP
ncbi:sugar lactone lactonase YvrE [Micromonospora pisi]|uniref:Sugar lactone lactonase YvrE n=1 Tax=Micromonospora pisi TaxID=589240 RepID=A0A495JF26_9ACTN|nr:superoxide dismutase [Micromonospora pisi]RKR87497.1 sugar lactone lactonase YvrE [Micromonospora pisi]